MTLLVTGSSGFLGRRAAAYLASLGHTVLTPSHSQLDITRESSVRAWFAEHRPDAVIHCAAISDTGVCQREPERSHVVNVEGPVLLAKACRETGAKLVFCSSDQVYSGSPYPGPHCEEEPLSPGNVYGRQKLLAEQQCAALCPDTVSLRLSWMYDDQSLPGEHGHFLTTLLSALRDPAQPLSWPVHDFRGMTHVGEVVRNLPAALSLPGGVYNFGAENDRDTFHTVRALLERLYLQEPLSRLTPNQEAFAQNPRDIRMDASTLHAAGITFRTTLQGLTETLGNLL